ncbi:NUMOD1 domain-containing DNA-binding protein [Niabella insulamsoli]|uniref:NUMOD1 domain-containing DNA-binding protein n=1 Tax=Niabella insulamsoli TaxID=3144874 RepID=UPI0031FD5D10
MKNQYEPTPIAVYDIEKKQPIGVFRSCSVAARYLFPLGNKESNAHRITERANRRTRIAGTTLGTVAIRFANEKQRKVTNEIRNQVQCYISDPSIGW